MPKTFDLVCMGRVAADLYGEQRGSSLEEATSFRRYLGGTSGNLAVGAARAGLRVGVVSRTGDDPMGHFLRRILRREGVDISAMPVDPDRRTALVFLGMQDAEVTGLDFYRNDAADMAIAKADLPEGYFGQAKALAISGSHFADADTDAACLEIVRAAKLCGCRLVLDIDYRAGLWAAASGGLSAARQRVQAVAAQADLVVGNIEEFTALAAREQLCAALQTLRQKSGAEFVVKVGPPGAAVVTGEVPQSSEDLNVVGGRRVTEVNPVGAGDAFLSSFLAAVLQDVPTEEALRRGAAAGALVVSRHACSAAMPFADELDLFLSGLPEDDPQITRLHRVRQRIERPDRLWILACDHREPFVKLMAETGRNHEDVATFKSLVARAAGRGAPDRAGAGGGMLMDARFGAKVLADLGRGNGWIGRPLEVTGSRPIELESDPALAETLREWPPSHVAKILVWHHPSDDPELVRTQVKTLHRVQASCNAQNIEWMLEIVPPVELGHDDATLLTAVAGMYREGLYPDYWKLPILRDRQAWNDLDDIVKRHDPMCRGVVVLGLNSPFAELADGLRLAGEHSLCIGFAVGRTIFGDVSQRWFEGSLNDDAAVAEMAENYLEIINCFEGTAKAVAESVRVQR